MLQIYKDNKLFFNLTFLFALIGAFILFTTEKGAVELWVNQHSTAFFDYFFYYLTYLGDGRLIALLIFLMLIVKVYYGMLGTIIFIISSIITQFMKRFIFHDHPRPSKFFDPSFNLKYIEGLEIHSWYSFPSGHASGAFTILLLISLISKNKSVQVICFFLAVFAAFSRVYLLQHFFQDVYGGALIGVVITWILYYLLHYKTSLPSNSKLNKPLSQVIWKNRS